MSDLEDEYLRRVSVWEQAADRERLELTRLYHEGWRCHESDPERTFALFTQARDGARRLEEPWWELFFEGWRLTALAAHLMDFTRALPLSVELMVRFSSPDGRAHPISTSVLMEVLSTYLNVDPFGYCDEIERGIAYLDGLISRGRVGERFVLNYTWISYLSATDRWTEAYELAMQSLALADRGPGARLGNWHGSWALYELCRICAVLGRMQEVAAHAKHLAKLSDLHQQLRRTRADAWFWRAVCRRDAGKENDAASSFHRGIATLDGLEQRDSICAEPMAHYYELGDDLKAVVGVRERELGEMTRKGRLHRVCMLRIELCRLLSRLGELKQGDLDAARDAARQLRTPDRYLERLDRLGLSAQQQP